MKFLFVGGTIHRKGVDVLLQAYRRAFTAQDDVCLVIKDMGVGSFYRGQTAERLIRDFMAEPSHPELVYLDQPLSDEHMAALYAACDCLVQPYRGEGFGLPFVEAMSCSLPVIVTGHGAALEFVDESVGWLIPAEVRHFPDARLGDLELVMPGQLAEPDPDALAAILREARDRPDLRRQRGRTARERVLAGLTWTHAVARAERRLLALRGRPRRRRPLAGSPALPTKKPGVSLCVIVKDEEPNIADCLACVRDLVQEMVVVDTGSTDRTREIARGMGALVSDFPWVDSFAAARNACLDWASHEWIFWLDADDRVDEENREKLRRLFTSLPPGRNVAYSMKCRCLPDASGMVTVVDHIRLFRNDPRVRWKYRIHEQILGAVKAAGGEVLWSDAAVDHTGYVDPALRATKLQRDLRLLRMEHAEQPEDPFTLFNLGATCAELGQHVEAVPLLEASLVRSHPADSIVRKLYALLVGCARHLGCRERALELCARGLTVCPDDAELLLLEGMIRTDVGDLNGARDSLLRLLNTETAQCFASVVDGLRTYRGKHQLAVVYRRLGQTQEAESLWKQVLQDSPGWPPACAKLARLYLEASRLEEMEAVLRELQRHPQGELEASLIRGEAFLARRDWAGARAHLERALAGRPGCLPLLSQYSFALLQEDRDHAQAEQTLLEVLRLDPSNKSARSNLEILRRRRPSGTTP